MDGQAPFTEPSPMVADDMPVGGRPTCEAGEHLPFIVLNASIMALVVQRYIEDGVCLSFDIHMGGVIPTGSRKKIQ